MKAFLTFALCILIGQTIYAKNYFCDPVHGNSNNNGSKEHPWGTLESVFKTGIKFESGDVIFLLSGNHGNVEVIGENDKYIKVVGVHGEVPIINSIIFGNNQFKASRWTFSNIIFKDSKNSNTVFIHENSSKIRLLENYFKSSNKNNIVAIKVNGVQCKIEHNVISNYNIGIYVSGLKNQIRNNRIEFFKSNAVEVLGSYNIFEYNLIKESVATDDVVNNGIFINNTETKGNIFRGNYIVNFTKINRDNIGGFNGIYSFNNAVSDCIFENNTVVTNTKNGIYLEGDVNNLKIVNNTVINPYFGLKVDDNSEINIPTAINIIGKNSSSNIIVGNNLSNNFLFENIKGFADNNLEIPVSVHDFDMCFKNWALFDFSLSKNSKALNAGFLKLAPTLDASLNKRMYGSFVNIGAYEYTKINESNETFTIVSEVSDRQIHSKGKGDWDGQPQIRVGGVAEGIDGAGIFPFKIPLIPQGKKILSASFSVYLSKIDNQPQGGIDLYGLTPKSNFWVTDDMFYQGTFGQDLSARPIQHNLIDAETYVGEIKMSDLGRNALKGYLSSIMESGAKAGDYIFLRINPNAKDVSDYNRWNFVSANSNKKENTPKLEITVGYPDKKPVTTTKTLPVKNIVVTSANPLKSGNVSFYFLGFENNKQVQLRLLNFSGEEVFAHSLIPSNLPDLVFRTENLGLSTGKYMLEYLIDGELKKQILFVW
ncbi:right-handed parallel beta-helix repeat-containing protein [Seonamhaeicola sp. NFXS20]|uniref:hypothetical protein n=1 Tax=Seonamhaeicola sp. NFXS20 TaxID=2816959 RepID=UPI003B8DA4DD